MNKAWDVTLVTYDRFPLLTEDDTLLADALRRVGARVRAAVWDDPNVDWSSSTVTVIRSTWDYFHKIAKFRAWIYEVAEKSRFANSAEVLLWNMDKTYLRDLQQRGVAIVPSAFITRGSKVEACSYAEREGWLDVVIKPTIAGSAFGAKRFNLTTQAHEADAHASALLLDRDIVLQPYICAVDRECERSMVFIDGEFSHAVLKTPFSGGAAVGEAQERDHVASDAEIKFGREVLLRVGRPLSYARVDIVPAGGSSLLMELEVIEPALFLSRAPKAARKLADAIHALIL